MKLDTTEDIVSILMRMYPRSAVSVECRANAKGIYWDVWVEGNITKTFDCQADMLIFLHALGYKSIWQSENLKAEAKEQIKQYEKKPLFKNRLGDRNE